MEKNKTIKQMLIMLVIVIMIIGILAIYPIRRIAIFPHESNYGKGEVWGSGNITVGKVISQDFYAKRGYLKKISIYMQNLQEKTNGNLIITIRNEEKELTNCRIALDSIENYEWYPIVLNTWLKTEGIYTLEMTTDAPEEGILQTFVTTAENAPAESREYCYENVVQESKLAINYQYTYPAENLWEAIPFIAIILLIGIIMIESILQFVDWHNGTRKGK